MTARRSAVQAMAFVALLTFPSGIIGAALYPINRDLLMSQIAQAIQGIDRSTGKMNADALRMLSTFRPAEASDRSCAVCKDVAAVVFEISANVWVDTGLLFAIYGICNEVITDEWEQIECLGISAYVLFVVMAGGAYFRIQYKDNPTAICQAAGYCPMLDIAHRS